MDAAIRELDRAYKNVPDYKTAEEWEVEKIILLYSLSAYTWYYAPQEQYEVVQNEYQFEMPLMNPVNQKAVPNVIIHGRIDKILKNSSGHYLVEEHKSTSKPIDSDSIYWKHLGLTNQSNIYSQALRNITIEGLNAQMWCGGILYDVWHKPTIRPKKLTQADSKKFVETGEYCGQKFGIKIEEGPLLLDDEKRGCLVNHTLTQIEPGKKEGTFTIKETPEMFGARLLQDISERPEFYFARKEYGVLDNQLEKFQKETYGVDKTDRKSGV